MEPQFAVFYHIWTPKDVAVGLLLVDEQLKRIQRSGIPNLSSVFCCISGAQCEIVAKLVGEYPWVNILDVTPDESKFEGLTLERLFDYCDQNDDLSGVGYIHTKGIRFLSSPPNYNILKCVNSWRHLLEWSAIDRWRECVDKLAQYDVVGVNFRSKPWAHFGGNFWWARPSYIKGLIRPDVGKFPPGEYSFVPQTGEERRAVTTRLDFERWVGLNNPKHFSFYGYPFRANGRLLAPEFHNIYENDIEPFYRENSF